MLNSIKGYNLNSRLFLLGMGHLVTDINQGALALVAILLKDKFDLSYFMVGFTILVGSVSSSVIQPLFGMLSDRYRATWLMPVGTLTAGAGMALAGIAPTYGLAVTALLISGLGVAAFHPESYKLAQAVAGKKKASGLSLFSVGGNLGFGLGPLLAGWFNKWWGLTGLICFLPIAAAMAFLLYRSTQELYEQQAVLQKDPNGGKSVNRISESPASVKWILAILLAVVFIRAWVTSGLTTYVPLYVVDILKETQEQSAGLLSYFLIIGALGTLLGGPIADRIGAGKLIVFSLTITAPLVLLIPLTQGLSLSILMTLIAITLYASFSSTIVLGQQLLPDHMGTVSGLIIGFAIGMGGVGVTVLGKIADVVGIPPIFYGMTGLLLVAVALTSVLIKQWKNKEKAATVQ
ncbi:MFS transporter [Heliobacterium chlorum]|uniref:MFS transporter n=1 Tax=Heliobacterium chlorum TaxID=2698 RepID=A0ABR7T2L2_HELCL|nr:MFS transporter [Heliobacterium chlorum]